MKKDFGLYRVLVVSLLAAIVIIQLLILLSLPPRVATIGDYEKADEATREQMMKKRPVVHGTVVIMN